MKALLIPLVLSLANCAGFGQPVTPTPAQQVIIASTDYGFDVTYNYAAKQYLRLAPTLSADQKAQIKPIFAKLLTCPTPGTPVGCTGAVALADQAAKVGDQTTLTAQVASIFALSTQITGLLGVAPPPAPH